MKKLYALTMKYGSIRRIAAYVLILAFMGAMGSCGTFRTYGGIEHEYSYDFDDGHYYKPPKHKKPKKHKKHKKHHHHHDDDDSVISMD